MRVRALMSWISALTRRDPRKMISLLSAMSLYNEKMVIGKSESRLSPDTRSSSTLILNFLASRKLRNECVLFKPPHLWSFVVAAQAKTGWKSIERRRARQRRMHVC